MTVCLPFSKIEFLTVNPRTGCIVFVVIMILMIHYSYAICYLNDIGTGVVVHSHRITQKRVPSSAIFL